ncbi:tRNA (adenosine(37)-N6)-threonylcarbamoyltransferase complex transferase subunit TsaD [Candidatus Microgenomates bacterium]|nr:tRNA (adenosine(37)-N6)-threonylcarbamoyltransferase complex transferase subunit TsaD [Candidatus Microgenomates bacterium]
MNILAIDTSCDETAVAVTRNVQVDSNIIWSQASLHAKFGGVMPSLAQRAHEERIDWVLKKALGTKHKNLKGIDAIAVTVGPGLSIALGVGVNKAKELGKKHSLPLIPVNHVEAHLLSPLGKSKNKKERVNLDLFPSFGLVLSGGTTLLCLIKNIGNYEILAESVDDALGEALDKAARQLGFGYPGAEILEKFAKRGSNDRFTLPIPLIGDSDKNRFSYSGLKSAFVRLYESVNNPNKEDIENLAHTFQHAAFKHIEKVLEYQIEKNDAPEIKNLLFGGGVSNNVEIRKMLRALCKRYNLKLHIPYSKKLMGDNAAMIGITAFLKNRDLSRDELLKKYSDYSSVDRNPKLNI